MTNIALLLMVAAIAGDAALQEQEPWEPVGKWALHLDPSSCSLGRTFSFQGRTVSLSVRSAVPLNPEFQFVTHEKGHRRRSATMQVSTDGSPPWSRQADGYLLGDGGTRYGVRLNPDAAAALLTSQRISVAVADRHFTVAAQGTASIPAALKDCEAALWKSWSVDPAAITKPRNPR